MPSRALTRIAALAVALPSGLAPSALRLLPAGRFKAADGSGRPSGIPDGWRLDAARASALVAAAADRQSDYVIDWEHQTLNAAANGQPAPAAGWYKRLEWRRDDGLYAVDVRWTPRAAAMIADGEYRYISPVFSYGADGEVLALGPAALTNNPGLDGLTDLAALSAYFPQEDSPMKNLLLALGLAETATEAEALAALNALKATHTTSLTAAAVADPAQYAPITTLTAIQGELANANTRLATLTAEKQSAEVAAVVAEGLAAGKLTPATKEWAAGLGKANLAALQAFLAAAPVIVKPGDTQSGGRDPGTGGAGADGLTETEIAVCKAMGMAHKDFVAARAAA